MNGDDPMKLVRQLAESYKGIKFGQGVVGKTSYATITLIGLWTVVVFRLSDNLWLNAALFGAGLMATGIYFWWVKKTQNFAEKNPGLAILEGAELIEYQKWDAEIKGIGVIDRGNLIDDPHKGRSK